MIEAIALGLAGIAALLTGRACIELLLPPTRGR